MFGKIDGYFLNTNNTNLSLITRIAIASKAKQSQYSYIIILKEYSRKNPAVLAGFYYYFFRYKSK
ncbi:hypothetical protein JOE44_002754 [Chryseobacterium sp. PvR013]|nr:hypothetical protein [Chryseobacterium sp. PvR013]